MGQILKFGKNLRYHQISRAILHKNANFQSPVMILSEKGSFDPLLTPFWPPGAKKSELIIIQKMAPTFWLSQRFQQLISEVKPSPNWSSHGTPLQLLEYLSKTWCADFSWCFQIFGASMTRFRSTIFAIDFTVNILNRQKVVKKENIGKTTTN